MNTELLLRIGFALLVFAFAMAGIGLSIWLGRRKTIGACSCDFDPAAERRKAHHGRCGDPHDCSCASTAKQENKPPPQECCGGGGCRT